MELSRNIISSRKFPVNYIFDAKFCILDVPGYPNEPGIESKGSCYSLKVRCIWTLMFENLYKANCGFLKVSLS